MLKIKFILKYYTKSKYIGMKKEHLKIFKTMEDLIDFRTDHKIKEYEIYKQIVWGEVWLMKNYLSGGMMK